MKSGAKKPGLPFRESVGAMVRMTHLAFAQDLQNHLAAYDIPVGMWFYLRALWEEDGVTQRVLSRRVGATEPTTALQLTKMEARGYIERRRCDSDRRNSHVHLTRRGRALQNKLLPYAVQVNATALAGLQPQEVTLLQTLLAQLRANLEQREHDRVTSGGGAQATPHSGRRPRAAQIRSGKD